MGFHCIACESNKGKTYLKKDAKAKDLISIACCQECGLVQLYDIPSEQSFLEFYTSKYRFEFRKQDKPSSKHVYRAGALAVSRLKQKKLIEYIFNGGLPKLLKKFPLTAQELYLSLGKVPIKILGSFLTCEELVDYEQL